MPIQSNHLWKILIFKKVKLLEIDYIYVVRIAIVVLFLDSSSVMEELACFSFVENATFFLNIFSENSTVHAGDLNVKE